MSDQPQPPSEIPVSAPVDTNSAGKGGPIALKSVVHIISPQLGIAGTGFLHKSGVVITAEHVIGGSSEVLIISALGNQIKASPLVIATDLDLGLLSLEEPLKASSLTISSGTDFAIGAQVTTWGFPGGYTGRVPLLSVGYLSGVDYSLSSGGDILQKWIVNAAFNRGNSGGPLLDIETGNVIGVVSSKIAPISEAAHSSLEALSKQRSGFVYTSTLPDGTQHNVSEGQVVAQVLSELRAQMQLVIGKAVMLSDLRHFLEDQGLDP